MELSKEFKSYLNNSESIPSEIDPETGKNWLAEIGVFKAILWAMYEFSFYGRVRHLITFIVPIRFRSLVHINNFLADFFVPLLIIALFSLGINTFYTEFLLFSSNAVLTNILYLTCFCCILLGLSRLPLFGGYLVSFISFSILQICLFKIYIPYIQPQLKSEVYSVFNLSLILFLIFMISALIISSLIKKVNISKTQPTVATVS